MFDARASRRRPDRMGHCNKETTAFTDWRSCSRPAVFIDVGRPEGIHSLVRGAWTRSPYSSPGVGAPDTQMGAWAAVSA